MSELGELVRDSVAATRALLGVDMTLIKADKSEVALTGCAIEEMTAAKALSLLGDEYAPEIGIPWAVIEIPYDSDAHANECLRHGSNDWIIRVITDTWAAGTLVALRCYCIRKALA